MKISVITPSYNQGDYIGRCIESVRGSSIRPLEHIILDNCSADQTSALLEQYKKDPRGVDLEIYVEKDNGQTEAINRGFQIATGDVVAWLNTDEFYYAKTLDLVAEFFQNHPDIDILYGDCAFLNSSCNFERTRKIHSFNRNILLYYGCYIPSCSTFIRKQVIEKGFLLDSAYRVCMDYEYYVRIADAGWNFSSVPDVLASFIWHGDNISRKWATRRREEEYAIRYKYGLNDKKPSLAMNILLDFLKQYFRLKRGIRYYRERRR